MNGGAIVGFRPLPRPENPDKGENPGAGEDSTGYPPFLPFPGPGTAQNAHAPDSAAALAAVRAYRRAPSPEPPRAPRRKPDAPPNRPRARGCLQGPDTTPLAAPPLPDVPLDWREGVALLAGRPAPDGIAPPRWRAFQATAARLLRDHGPELHAAGWDALDLFGLYAIAPAANPPGWGLAWLLGERGGVLDVAPGVIGMRWGPDGARLGFYRQQGMGRTGIVPAWGFTISVCSVG